jgi:hypothetical protein
LVQDRENFS